MVSTASYVDIRVRAGVGHRQEEGAVVLELEVLVGKLLAINGLATSTLLCVSRLPLFVASWRWSGLRCRE
jgi:hypothetical protein